MNIQEIALTSLLSAIDARDWKVCCFEDNAGGLHLAIWRGKGKKTGKTWFAIAVTNIITVSLLLT